MNRLTMFRHYWLLSPSASVWRREYTVSRRYASDSFEWFVGTNHRTTVINRTNACIGKHWYPVFNNLNPLTWQTIYKKTNYITFGVGRSIIRNGTLLLRLLITVNRRNWNLGSQHSFDSNIDFISTQMCSYIFNLWNVSHYCTPDIKQLYTVLWLGSTSYVLWSVILG